MYYVAALVIISIFLYTSVTGAKEYKVFQKLTDSIERQKYYRRWVWQPWVFFGLLGVLTLIAVGDSQYIFKPLTHSSINALSSQSSKDGDTSMTSFYLGLAVGLILAVVILIVRLRRSFQRKLAAGNTDTLLPRNQKERRLGGLLALSAGINEEIFFRAAIPLVAYKIFDSTTIAIAISVILFGLAHYYQGWKGVLGTAVIGWVLMKAFTLSGSIFVPIAIHTAIDLWSLVIVPYVMAKRSHATSRT